MKFHYIASQPNGRVVEGDINVAASSEVLQFLMSRGLRPISVKEIKSFDLGSVQIFGQSISVSDKIFLTRYLSLMLKAGTDLFRAIDILINDLDKPILKTLLLEIKANLEKGNQFYITFLKYPKHFSPVFVNLIRAGEASGNLTEILDNLSVSLNKELRDKIRSALIYPVILLAMSFLMLMLLVIFALPKIANVFLSTGIKPPLFSYVVFSTGLFLNEYSAIVFPLFAAILAGGWYFFFKSYIGRQFAALVGSRLPVIGEVMDQIALQRFTSTLSSLMRAGLPIIEALEITANAIGSDKFKRSLQNIAREGIAKGLTIGESFRREPAFPLVITNLISVSEKAGHIEEILKTLSVFYESEVDNAVKTLVAFIEPILLLFIGILIGTIALAIIIPIYQLVGGI